LTAAFQHVVRPTLGNRLNPNLKKEQPLLSAVDLRRACLLSAAQRAVTKHAALDGAVLHLMQWSKT